MGHGWDPQGLSPGSPWASATPGLDWAEMGLSPCS